MGVWALTAFCNESAAASQAVNLTELSRQQVWHAARLLCRAQLGAANSTARACPQRYQRPWHQPVNACTLRVRSSLKGGEGRACADAHRRWHWLLPQVFQRHVPHLVRLHACMAHGYRLTAAAPKRAISSVHARLFARLRAGSGHSGASTLQ